MSYGLTYKRFQEGKTLRCRYHGAHFHWTKSSHKQGKMRCNLCRQDRENDKSSDVHLAYRIRTSKKSAKDRGHEFNINIDHLKQLWTAQEGKCALTGDTFNPRYNFSIDRIDSSIGYIPSNIQLVLLQVNLCKQKLSNSDFIKLAIKVTEFARTVGLKQPVQPGDGTGLSKENLASIPPLACAVTFFLESAVSY